MLELANKAFESLSAFPIIQIALGIVIIITSLVLVRKGEGDRKSGGSGASSNVEMPLYLIGGPVHDAIGAIHDMAEQGRITNKLIEVSNQKLEAIDRGQLYVIQLLEELNNERVTASKSGLPASIHRPKR